MSFPQPSRFSFSFVPDRSGNHHDSVWRLYFHRASQLAISAIPSNHWLAMLSSTPVVADGSALADAPERVTIDPDDGDVWRYRCPRGHTTWSPTNSHLWCKSCRDQADAGDDVDPEWYELLDLKTGETIPWSAVEIVE